MKVAMMNVAMVNVAMFRQRPLVVGILFALSSEWVFAQAGSEDINNESSTSFLGLEEIVVTASKRATLMQSTPIAVTAIDTDELQAANIGSIRDLAALTPSLVMQPNAGQEFPIGLRGISSGAQGAGGDSPVAIYLDGVYLGRQQASTFDFADIERIEVSRGPQGTLFGRNNTGGAIRVITRIPTEEPTYSATVRVGNYNQNTVKGSASGPLSDSLFFKFAGVTSQDDGFQKFVDTGKEANGEENVALNAGLRWVVSDNTEVIFRADKSRSDIQAYLRLASDNFTGFGPSDCEIGCDIITSGDKSAFETIENQGVSATVNVDFYSTTLKSITAYREFNSDQLIDTDAVLSRISQFGQTQESDQFSQEFVLSSTGTGPLQWLVGAYYFKENTDLLYQIKFFNGFDANRDRQYTVADDLDGDGLPEHQLITGVPEFTTESYALFMDGSYELTDKLKISLGIRYSDESKEFYRVGSVDAINSTELVPEGGIGFLPATSLEFDQDESWQSTDGRIVLDYQFSKDLFGYASASTGFKSGGYSFSVGGVFDAAFDPEEVEAFEVGLKSDLLDYTLRVNISAFYYDYTDMQISLAPQPGVRSIFNVGSSEITGIEAEFSWLPIALDGFRLSGNISVLDATNKEFEIDFSGLNARAAADNCQGGDLGADLVCDLSGNKLPRAPDLTFTLIGEYSLALDSGAYLVPRVQVRYEDTTFYTEQNVDYLSHDDITLVDARLTFQPADSSWSLSLWGQNLTDERYLAGGRPTSIRPSGVPGSPFPNGTTTGGWGIPNYPLSYGVEFNYLFN